MAAPVLGTARQQLQTAIVERQQGGVGIVEWWRGVDDKRMGLGMVE